MAGTWAELVVESFERGYFYPCCVHCSPDAVCCDDHDTPCPDCRQPPLNPEFCR